MSHEILSAVFSNREGAGWTGLGQAIPVEIARDPQKIAELCGATYKVEKRQCFFKDAAGRLVAAKGREVLVRSDTNEMLEVVSDSRYHVTNRQPVDIFEAFRDELAANKLEISHAAVLRGGAIIAVCAALPESMDITVGAKDKVKSYLTLSSGYDKKHGTKCTKGTMRVVCANTLAASLAMAADRDQLRTIRASTVLEETSLKDLLARVDTLVATEKATFNALANTRMSDENVARYFADVLEIDISLLNKVNVNGRKLVSSKAENMLKELATAYRSAPGAAMASGTAWGALNAVTYFATHVKTVRDTTSDGEHVARVASNMFGDAAKLKLRALELAAQRVPQLALAA